MEDHQYTVYTRNVEGADGIEAGKKATKAILQKNSDLTALIYDKDLYAIGGAHYCYENQISIPEDLAIAGFDDSLMAKNWIPGLTSVDDKIGIMGTKCVQALFEMIEEGVTVAQMMLIPEIIVRDSTAAERKDK